MAKGKAKERRQSNASGKGRKRKTVDLLSSEEVSSQSQDSQTADKYVPRFGNALKKARLDLTRERRSSGSQSSLLQGESCTQPTIDDGHTSDSSEMASATQPLSKSSTGAEVSRKVEDGESCTQPINDHISMLPTPSSFVPGLTLSQSERPPHDHSSSDLESDEKMNQLCDKDVCGNENGDSAHSLSINQEHSDNPCDELKNDAEASISFLTEDRESDPMNLKLLNPLCMDSDSDEEHIVKAEHSTIMSGSKHVPGLNNDGILPGNLKGMELTTEGLKIDSSEQTDPVDKSTGRPPLVNIPSQPIDDATLPNSQELPVDSAQTESLYEDNSQTKKDLPSGDPQTTNVLENNVVTDEELAIQEMMDLEAEDLEESQLSHLLPEENATVPSLSPQGLVQQSEHNSLSEVAHKPSYAFSTRPSVCTNPDGEAVLKGLVEELSSINRFIIRCKKDMENARRQREIRLKSRQQHPHHS